VAIIKAIVVLIRAFLVSRLSLAAKILALRQQVAAYKHSVKRPKLRRRDRIFWGWLSRLWPEWQSAPAIVQPQTVVKWHQQGCPLY
jgi:hypothetical protein